MSSKTSQSEANSGAQASLDYWRVFRDLPEPYLLFEASGPDYTIIDVNKARENITGISRAACIGRPLFTIYPYTDDHFRMTVGRNIRTRLKDVIRTARPQQLEPYHQTVVGARGVKRNIYLQATYLPLLDASGSVRAILAATREVTDKLQAKERVAEAEGRLAAALTIGKVGSWVFDTTTGLINGDESFRKLFNMSRPRARSLDLGAFLEAVHEQDRTRVKAAVKRSISRHQPFEEEYRVILGDGTQRWVLARGAPEEHDGHPVFPGVVVDITERHDLQAQVELARRQDSLNRQAARVLQQRNEQLEAIARSKDEFVALASHQLRTPATAVKQYIGMALQGYVGDIDEQQAEVLTKAFESNERQIQIINQILSAARADTGRLVMTTVSIDIGSLARGIASEMEPTFGQRRQIFSVEVPEDPIRVSADLTYLRMAIENILHNASVYTPVGGTIRLRVQQTAKICLLSVSDTGVGIKKADIDKLFVKFSRIHNPLSVEAGGSGIGLYLTAEIIRLHDGETTVESRVGRGSTFTISLPLIRVEDGAKAA